MKKEEVKSTVVEVDGKTICEVIAEPVHDNYFRLRIVFPNGSYKDIYAGYNRLTPKVDMKKAR